MSTDFFVYHIAVNSIQAIIHIWVYIFNLNFVHNFPILCMLFLFAGDQCYFSCIELLAKRLFDHRLLRSLLQCPMLLCNMCFRLNLFSLIDQSTGVEQFYSGFIEFMYSECATPIQFHHTSIVVHVSA